MSETKWTPAQRAAIDDRGGALLVSAAAGSGKTAVLTERAVRLITDPEHPVDADRLLIVTFTNAAAAELRARIGQALLRRSQAEPGSTALRRQRMLLQRASICTIDAFCLDLLHKHFQALDIPPDFAPADPGSVEMLRNAALSETLEAAYQDADFCAFADLYGKGRTDKAAGEAVLQVYDFLRALPDYDKKLDEMLAPWQDENGFARTCWHDILMQEAARSARAAKELLCAAQNDCREDFVTAQSDAEASKKTPAAKEKAVAAVNEKFAEPLERLENSAALLGEVERLAGAGEWTPLYDRLTPYVLGMEQAPGLKNNEKDGSPVSTRTPSRPGPTRPRSSLRRSKTSSVAASTKPSLTAALPNPASAPSLPPCGTSTPALRPGSGRGDCWNSATSSIWPCGSCGTPTASLPSCVRASGRATPPSWWMSIRTRTPCRTPFTAVWPARQGMTSSSWAT